MPLILITGISTSGKSTVAKELVKRGYEAYDTEHNGISAWHDKKSGKRVAEFGKVPERTEEWLNQHEWLISTKWVNEITKKAQNKPIFLCGGGANEAEVCAKCQKVIWLKTNEQTIKKRMQYPRDHDYGTKPHELAAILKSNQQKEIEYHDQGATIIDATQSVDMVVDKIISKSINI